ncbi:recombinase family protein [Kitasatospora sp. NPDC048545]|uniref:recombinase family protein n=1 Tax=Kitasatospora sp. NPDC048545 TaxID=3157208 RepID=UPI0033E9D7B1
MSDDLVQRAHWGDLTGLNLAGLVRLSFEPDYGGDEDEATEQQDKFTPFTGRDIKGRDEQEKDARGFVEHRRGNYVYTYEEPDTSAWKRKRVRLPDGRITYRVVRPVFEGALEDLKKGRTPDGHRLDGLIVYDIDRLTRDNRHLEDAIEVVQNFRRPIIDITGTLDLLTDNGRTVARIMVATNNKQSADTARRVKRKHQALQQAGIPAGGRRPYGWAADKRSLEPAEAKNIRDAVERLIKGAGVRTIVADWNRKGLTTPAGSQWTNANLKNVLRNPRICGYRSRWVSDIDPETGRENKRCEIVLDDKGKPVRGQFDPIISVTEWEALTDAIGTGPAPGSGHNARKYLLSGILRCDKNGCGAPLRAQKSPPSRKKAPGYFYYVCPGKTEGRGCGGTRLAGPETDELLIKLVISKYEEEAAQRQAETIPSEWDKEGELARVREDRDELKKARRARQVTAERYFADLAEYDAEERRLVSERNQWLRATFAAQGEPVNLGKDWDTLTFPAQRGYLEKALLCVLVAPAAAPNRPIRDRLSPLFRERIAGL